ncbi:hypothetical protein [Acetanaerobacterium elongatum]|uniref:Uncharacterized protein n=1 Tax=Acetanaerobacterium elongatum TaxID=258515 RepID=A0A1H0H4W1_9FIRM|nr:hypothetical protein [Acetanaerobacterium elongatum]SDO14104.1 hypothetical protein SAMN05192585_1616 [Acetanaerobacterium elongatum]
MKRLAALLLTGILAFSLTACSQKVSEQEYYSAMGELADSYSLMADTLDLSLQTYSDTAEWWDAVDSLKQSNDEVVSTLEKEVTPYVPDSLAQQHKDIVSAITAYSDAMQKIMAAKDAASAEEKQTAVDESTKLVAAASEQWQAAIATLK